MVGKIFLNYRRATDAWAADRLNDRLKAQLPGAEIFIDIDGSIPLGLPWAQWLDSQVAECDLMLVLIGRSWESEFEARSAAGERDFVRVEIERALDRKIPVVPILLDDAPVPPAARLPASIRPLLELQATRLQRANFEVDAKALIDGVQRSITLARGAQGRIKVHAKYVHDAPDGWFLPGNGKTEWFKDHDAGPEMVVVPAGSFIMGWGEQVRVSIAAPFAVGRFCVTLGQFSAFAESVKLKYRRDCVTHYHASRGEITFKNPGFSQVASSPVVCITWQDAYEYARWLSKITGKKYRLLSEAEWEYVARASTTTEYWFGNEIRKNEANFDSSKGTMPVDAFKPNPWGLYNVHGNVWEFAEDTSQETYGGAPTDGSTGSERSISLHVVRGGAWTSGARSIRSASRGFPMFDAPEDNTGFRVARTL